MSNIIDSIQLSGVTYQIQGSGGGVPESTFTAYTATTDERMSQDEEVTAAGLNALNDKITPTVELTQAQYDALVTAGTVSADTYYIITDATPVDMSNYYTTAQTNTLLAGKQATLVSGTNIKTINNESLLGSGNIDIQGGGKAIEAGRGISIATGATADTVSFNLPISAGTGSDSIIEGFSTSAMSYGDHAEGVRTYAKNGSTYPAHAEGYQTSATSYCCHAEGNGTKASGEVAHAEGKSTEASGSQSHAEGYGTKVLANYSHAEGYGTTATSVSNVAGITTFYGYQTRHAEGHSTKANNASTHTEGYYTEANNFGEHASGVFNVSNSATTTYGDSGNTLFSVGNGTSNNARHNAFEIRQNGDIYLTKDGQDVKLQDQLGGSSITVDTALDSGSTNPVENRVIYNKIDEVEQVTAAGLNALNDNFGGLKLVKLTQAEYNALTIKDAGTLYIILG